MKHGYGERLEGLSLTVDKVGEDEEGNHLVEVSVHDRMEEINVRMFVSKEYYGTMIPWLAARVVISDLAASPYERVRRLDAGRLYPDIRLEDAAAYLRDLDSVPELSKKASELPEHLLRGHMMYLSEIGTSGAPAPSSTASLHNAHKLIFDRGLPDVLEFVIYSLGDYAAVLARWNGRTVKYEHVFYGFDWRTTEGKAALGEFLEMLNLHHPIGMEDLRPRRIPRKEGPKEWSPHEIHNFLLYKGRDYGRPQ